MKLLFITQKVNDHDPILGFVTGWLSVFASQFETIEVVCLEKGQFNLPDNIRVFSLGKEKKISRLIYIRRFYQHLFELRGKYDAVFVHMNAEYVILGGLIWLLSGKKIALWYNHSSHNFRLRLAMRLTNLVLHTSPFAASANSSKSIRMPTGIDIENFKPGLSPRESGSVLSLGRIAPIKKNEIIISAFKGLLMNGLVSKLSIVGPTLPKDCSYESVLKNLASDDAKILFLGSVSDRNEVARLFNRHEMFVNASPAGLFDKTIFEAMASGCLPLVSSPAFKDILPTDCLFTEGDSEDLAHKLKDLLQKSELEKQEMRDHLRKFVVGSHSLDQLAIEIKKLYE